MHNRLLPYIPVFPIKGALILNFDHVLYHSSNNDTTGELYDIPLLTALFKEASDLGYATYIVSERPESQEAKIEAILQPLGNIKRGSIRCLGKHVDIENIHQAELSHLPKSRIIYAGSESQNFDSVKAAGYVTFLAKAFSDKSHLHLIHKFLTLKHVTTLGNYSVLNKPDEAIDHPLDRTEFFAKAEHKELNGESWRLRTLIDFAAAARTCINNPNELPTYQALLQSEKQRIIFSNDEKEMEAHIRENSMGTANSLLDLADKDCIILLGSESKRKLGPLKSAVMGSGTTQRVAYIGLPTESCVDTQPSDYQQTEEGMKNRRSQLFLFRNNLRQLLRKVTGKCPEIACLAIENGLTMHPVSILENEPARPNKPAERRMCYSFEFLKEGENYCFGDQAAIFFEYKEEQHYEITKPTTLSFTLMHSDRESFQEMFTDTVQYYRKQSEWCREMKRRINDPSIGPPYPVRKEGDKVYTSADLIQQTLQSLFTKLLKSTPKWFNDGGDNSPRNTKSVTADCEATLVHKI